MTNIVPVFTGLVFAALLTGIGANAAAQEIDHAGRYSTCMEQAATAPKAAFEAALRWRDLGGGEAADHCIAAALMGLGQYSKAAGRLEKLAERSKSKTGVKAGLLAHAARARMLAGQSFRAAAVLTAALKLNPDDGALMIDRAQARAGTRDYAGAVEDLSRAIGLGVRPADALVFRASAYRLLDKLELALADVERALALQPGHPDGLLERGSLRRMRRDDDGARQDWLAVIRDNPTGPVADAARRNLENMDVKTTP
jgi:regulator of sirC expression with transglutaminase-like and TPR domain